MKLLIVEDEPPIAEDIKDMCTSILGSKAERIDIRHTMDDALEYLVHHTIDLCVLDLNLKGENGYEILHSTVSRSFHTIIVSAHTEQAFEAFDYGILDFVPKPVDRRRLKTALEKYFGTVRNRDEGIKYLVVRRQHSNHLIAVKEIRYFEAQGYLVKMFLRDGKFELIDKPLNRLIQVLPREFLQVHRSYIVAIEEVASFRHKGGGTYALRLKGGGGTSPEPQGLQATQLQHRRNVGTRVYAGRTSPAPLSPKYSIAASSANPGYRGNWSGSSPAVSFRVPSFVFRTPATTSAVVCMKPRRPGQFG